MYSKDMVGIQVRRFSQQGDIEVFKLFVVGEAVSVLQGQQKACRSIDLLLNFEDFQTLKKRFTDDFYMKSIGETKVPTLAFDHVEVHQLPPGLDVETTMSSNGIFFTKEEFEWSVC